ncbi:hypothetical protein PLICRDRAFT_100147 [Plicaturopsis crispa FD-325 SS-3]|nr:hypothetical protein PLICRDRAFT_100147 [Plicaturopsis crispa FD-325 SS-3]
MSSSGATPLLISPLQLSKLAPSSDVAILDATWFMPNAPRNAREEFASKRIPGARYLDLDEVASAHELGLKHMMPEGRVFADACEKLGISPSSHVVIYDAHGVFSSPRALLMFKSFGHEKTSVLDGGLPRWESEGLKVDQYTPMDEEKPPSYPTPSLDERVVRSYTQMVSNSSFDPTVDLNAELVLDARPRARFEGKAPEPRPDIPSGHIPNSFSLPFDTFLQTHSSPTLRSSATFTTYRPPSEIRKALVDAVGVDQAELIISGKRPVTATCGSGMTAGVIWLGLKLLGVDQIGLYDESWTGYAARKSSRIEKSP